MSDSSEKNLFSAETRQEESCGCADTVHEDQEGISTLPDHQVVPRLSRGDSAGRYVILDVLGAGGMGVVYKAYDPKMDRRVALKLLHVESGDGKGARARERLLREAQALAQLSHPNVVSAYDVGTLADEVFVAMELVEGKTLTKFLQEDRPSYRQIVEIMIAAGRGIAAAHRAGLIHRDLKPDNILVGSDDRTRVLDFGLARAASADGEQQPVEVDDEDLDRVIKSSSISNHSPLTAAGTIMGSPGYMAPEQCLGEAIDEKTDQFGFCATLYSALYRVPAFSANSWKELKRKVVMGEFAPVPAKTKVPAWLRRIAVRGMSPDRDQRFASMDAVLAALGRDPRIKWRRAAMVSAVIALVATSVGITAAWKAGRVKLCQGAEKKLIGVWDPGAKESLQKAFVASANPFAQEALDRVGQLLDQRAAAWTAMRSDACQATHVRGEQSAELLDRRMICLDKRLAETQALVQVLGRADAKVVAKSVEAAHALVPVARCAELESLSQQLAPPRGEKQKTQVAKIRQKLVEANAFSATGQYEPALDLAKLALTLAEQSAYRPVRAEALFQVSELLQFAGKYPEAEQRASEAWLAAETIGDDELKIQAATALAALIGYLQVRQDQGRRWSARAWAAIERLGGMERHRAPWHMATGNIDWSEGKGKEAGQHYQQALVILEKIHGPHHPNVGKVLNNLGGVYENLGEYDRARDYHRRALATFEQALGANHPYVGISLNNLANVYHRQRDFPTALAYNLRVLSIRQKTLGANHPYLGGTYNNLGDLYVQTGDTQAGLQAYRKALAINEKSLGPKHPDVANVLVGLSGILLHLGDEKGAATAAQRAFDIHEHANPNHPDMSLALISLAEIRLRQKKLPEARGLLERCLSLCEQVVCMPEKIPEAQARLAQILWQSACDQTGGSPGPACRRRSRAWAQKARDGFAKTKHEDERHRIEQWLAEH